MYRGTTPTLTFTLPFPCDQLSIVSIAFAQKKPNYAKDAEIVLEKTLCDCQMNGNTLTLTLTEEDTLALDCHCLVEIQLRAKVGDVTMASEIITESVGRILKDGCLE